jgi:hypothetical protein
MIYELLILSIPALLFMLASKVIAWYIGGRVFRVVQKAYLEDELDILKPITKELSSCLFFVILFFYYLPSLLFILARVL